MDIWKHISDNYFGVVADRTVLEIGSFDGRFSELILGHHPRQLTLLEFDRQFSRMLSDRYSRHQNVSVIHGDMHLNLSSAGPHDVVIVLGVIYHSHAPLHLLEEIVNVCAPQILLLDAPGSEPGNTVRINSEEPNATGMRYTDRSYCCKLTMNIGHDIIIQAMTNMGYELAQFEILPTDGEIKVSHVPFFKFEKI